MQSPRAPGAGHTGAASKSLAGDRLDPTVTGPETQRKFNAALRINSAVGEGQVALRLVR
jgi:hypothetical protein